MIVLGDCLEVLRGFEGCSFDAVVTDPPYGLSFMGKKWDYDVPSVALWKEVFRVLKPGGHLLSFGGSRTYHRMACAIEDAGFEIRDQIMWVYGSGFPKSLNIGKAVDKLQGNEREVVGNNGIVRKAGGTFVSDNEGVREYTKGTSPYEGWGTALKPAHEPIVMARKPLSESTVAKNVLKWGTGGINIDGCRVGTGREKAQKQGVSNSLTQVAGRDETNLKEYPEDLGRFPANFIHDGLFGEKWTRYFYCPKASKAERNKGCEKNGHPTVKPIALMEYLIKLVTPKGGKILDPFMGSGTTLVASKKLGIEATGVERDPEYVKIAEARLVGQKDRVTYDLKRRG